jgi:hypothetical protein
MVGIVSESTLPEQKTLTVPLNMYPGLIPFQIFHVCVNPRYLCGLMRTSLQESLFLRQHVEQTPRLAMVCLLGCTYVRPAKSVSFRIGVNGKN